ncbi:MAG: hypothetical protein JXB13_12410 [Phycisphaerae bacterium]|nr:hypothetical protein [Phycisphaerae bacterium]
MSVSPSDISRVVSPLHAIFWGGILYIIDVNIGVSANENGWQLDLLNDLLGMVLITWGVIKLAGMDVDASYGKAMVFVSIVAGLSCLEALHAHRVYQVPPLLSFMLSVLGLAQAAAVVVFCVAMRWLSAASHLVASARSWRTTTWLFIIIYAIPIVLTHVAGILAVLAGTSFEYKLNLGAEGLGLMVPLLAVVVVVMAIPVIHLFVSTSRMKREAGTVVGAGATYAVDLLPDGRNLFGVFPDRDSDQTSE